MLLKLKTAPALEPVTLAEVRKHLHLDSQSLADNLAAVQSIAPGSHAVVPAYGLLGAAVAVQGYEVLVTLEAGTCGAGGSVAAKLQESANGAAGWTDVSGGAFATVTEANDQSTQAKAYTGSQPYLRVVATVAGAASDFGATVLKSAPYATEDPYLNALITAAREQVESLCGPLLTQTWEQYEAGWPPGDRLSLGKSRLLTVESLKYLDADGVEATLAATVYAVDIVNGVKPALVLKKDQSWPTAELFMLNPIVATFTCGYGAAAANVPQSLRHAMLLLIGHWYEERQPVLTSMGGGAVLPIPWTVEALLANYRVW